MRIAVTGASGMVGTALLPFLEAAGHTPVPVSRQQVPGGIRWDPAHGIIDPAEFEGLDAVVHLAGESIAGKRWSNARKRELRDSRVGPTALLARTLAGLRRQPAVFVSASGLGIYGEQGDRVVDESTPPGDDFLGRLAVAWEAAAEPARSAGIRVVHPRLATILAPAGGALEKMIPVFTLGLGGPLAGGAHWMAWVAIDDVLRAILFVIETPSVHGPVNVTAPGVVRNDEFTRELGRALHRPAVMPVPRLALTMLYGELADAALLTSIRAVPAALERAGFVFRYPSLRDALANVLARRDAAR